MRQHSLIKSLVKLGEVVEVTSAYLESLFIFVKECRGRGLKVKVV